MAVVADWEKKTKALAGAPAASYPRQTRTKFISLMTQWERLTGDKSSLSQLQVTDRAEVEDVKTRLRKIVQNLQVIISARGAKRRAPGAARAAAK